MTNCINYFNHITTEPNYYQRDYAQDLFLSDDCSDWVTQTQRIAIATLPFFSLYKPLTTPLSLGLGSLRVVSYFSHSIHSFINGSLKAGFWNLYQTIFAVIALASTILSSTLGMVITTLNDLMSSIVDTIKHVLNGDYEAALDISMQIISSILYLTIIFTGSLEITLISLIIQALISAVKAKEDFISGNYLEGVLGIFLSAIRCWQAGITGSQIQQRNHLYKQYKELFDNFDQTKQIGHLIDVPFDELTIEESLVKLSDAKGNEYELGSHFHGFGKGLVKGQNLCFRVKMVEGKACIELDFKINHAFHEAVQNQIDNLEKIPKDELKAFIDLSKAHFSNIEIQKIPNQISEKLSLGSAYKVVFEDLGSISIGASNFLPNLYDRIVVQMQSDTNFYQMHEMLSYLGLNDALRAAVSEDVERMKIGQLFRSFYPREALSLERKEAFFELPIEELKNEILCLRPEMEPIFDEFLHKMKTYEILPGRLRYSIPGLADKARSEGAVALTSVITGAYSDSEIYNRVASILKMGMLSTETRYENGINVSGLSPSSDFYTGGADSTFTQLITEKSSREGVEFGHFYYQGKVRLLFSVDLLETGTYQYHYDEFGCRLTEFPNSTYNSRPGIIEFLQEENQTTSFYPGNEVMIKERISPSSITGIVVQTQTQKNELLGYLRSSHLIQTDAFGVDTILDKPVDRFILVGSNTQMLLT